MGDIRTYEDFAGMLGRRVARVKEACGGAVGRKQPGGILGYPLGLIPGVEKMSESWKNPSVATKKNGELKARRGFLGFNEDYYGDAAGRYGFFSVYKSPNDLRADAFLTMKTADENERMYQSTGIEEYRDRAERYRAKAEELYRKADDRSIGNRQRIADYEAKTGNQVAKKRNGGNIGNIMRYTVYFKDGGLLPRSQRRVYQTGGKASAQDMLAMLVQGAQILTSGKGTKKQQQQAQQMYIQMYQEALQGNQQYAQLIQAVFDGVQQGNQELVPVAQIFQEIAKQYQNKVSAAEFGGRLDYITMLRNGGRPRYQPGGEVRTYGDEIRARLGKIGPIISKLGRRLGFGKGAGKDVVNAADDGADAVADAVADADDRTGVFTDPWYIDDYIENQHPVAMRPEREPLPEVRNELYGLRDPYWYGWRGDYDDYINGYMSSDDYQRYLELYRRSSGNSLPFQSGLAGPRQRVEYNDKGAKVKRGFFGRNEDRYGDAMGRYGFFSMYSSPDQIRKRSQSYLDRMEKHRDPRNVYKGIYTPEEQKIINMVERNMAKADEIERVNNERRFQYQQKPDFIQREEP